MPEQERKSVSVSRAQTILGEIRSDIYSNPKKLDILLQVIYELEGYFTTVDKIKNWLIKPKVALSGAIPLDLIAQNKGHTLLEELDRLSHGIC